jgi:plasmid maintenance system killer protein
LLKEQIEVLQNQLPKATELESRVNIIEKSYEKEMKEFKSNTKSELVEMIDLAGEFQFRLNQQQKIFCEFSEKAKNLSLEEKIELAADCFYKFYTNTFLAF